MKKNIFYFTLLLMFVLFGCKKKQADYYRSIEIDPWYNIKGLVSVDEEIIDKVNCYHFYYDDLKNVIQIEYLKKGELSKDKKYKAAIIKIVYSDSIISQTFYDKRSNKIRNKYFVHKKKLFLNEETKFPVMMKYYGINNQLVADEGGVATTLWVLNEKGQRVKASYLDINGDVAIVNNGVKSNNIMFDDKDNLIQIKYNYKDSISENSIAYRIFNYDKWGNQVSIKDFNNQDELLDEAYWVKKYDKNGNRIEVSIKNPNLSINEPIIKDTKVARIKYKYDKYWQVTKIIYFDRFDELTKNQNGVEIVKYTIDDNQNIIERSFFDSKEKPTNNKKGLAKIVAVYDTNEYLINENYYDKTGRKLQKDTSYLTSIAKYYIDKYPFWTLIGSESDSTKLEYLNRAINLYSSDPIAYAFRAKLLLKMGQLGLAKNDAEKALLLPMNEYADIANAYISIIDISLELEEWSKAIFYLTKQIDLQNANEEIASSLSTFINYEKRADCYIKLGLVNNAIDDLNVALNYSNEHLIQENYLYEAVLNLALIYYNEKQDYEKAKNLFDYCITIYEIGENFHFRGLCNLQLGYNQSACNDFNKAIELGYKKAVEYSRIHCN